MVRQFWNVGCETCHGGDPRSFEPFVAHKDILARTNPASPVHPTNLPKTCGTCHTGPLVAFQRSKHYELLRAGNKNGPTCTTCHGEAAGNRLSPKALEGQCATCHGAGKIAPPPEFPARARLADEGLREARALLKDARHAIARVKDTARRASLEQAAQQRVSWPAAGKAARTSSRPRNRPKCQSSRQRRPVTRSSTTSSMSG